MSTVRIVLTRQDDDGKHLVQDYENAQGRVTNDMLYVYRRHGCTAVMVQRTRTVTRFSVCCPHSGQRMRRIVRSAAENTLNDHARADARRSNLDR